MSSCPPIIVICSVLLNSVQKANRVLDDTSVTDEENDDLRLTYLELHAS